LINAYEDKAKKDRDEKEKDKGKKRKGKDIASTDAAADDSNASATSAPPKKKKAAAAASAASEVDDATRCVLFLLFSTLYFYHSTRARPRQIFQFQAAAAAVERAVVNRSTYNPRSKVCLRLRRTPDLNRTLCGTDAVRFIFE